MIDRRGLDIPFVRFGPEVTSDDLFCAKEQALFDFYAAAKDRYRSALDIGANIGVHTILMARNGWKVMAFEPDPNIYSQCVENITANLSGFRGVLVTLGAVSDHEGRTTFVRVKNNMTGSHLKGDKVSYGETDEFEVQVFDCRKIFYKYDFAKIDCEGHEARLLCTVTPSLKADFMVEVGNEQNANAIFTHMRRIRRRMWAQKLDWQEVRSLADIPKHHSEGALFIGDSIPFT